MGGLGDAVETSLAYKNNTNCCQSIELVTSPVDSPLCLFPCGNGNGHSATVTKFSVTDAKWLWIIVPLYSPGGSTLQCGAGRDLLRLASLIVYDALNTFSMPTDRR